MFSKCFPKLNKDMGFLKRLFGNDDTQPKEKHPLEEEVNYYIPKDDSDIGLMKTSVAGITHHLKLSDAPMTVQGHTRFEPENPYNNKAVVLITDDGKQIGYIPDRELSLYYNIFDKEDVQFFGAIGIFRNDSNKRTLYGKIMLVSIPDNQKGELHQQLAQKQLDYMMAAFTSE